MVEERESPAPQTQLVWDLPVRVFHWLLVAAVLGTWVTYKIGVQAFTWHAWFGYFSLVLVAFRLVWGFVGPRHARFTNFLRGPGVTWNYARRWFVSRREQHAGHNPLGGWMVMLLLALVAAEGGTGLFANDEIFNTGPLYGYVSDATSDGFSHWHRRLADILWCAVGLHIAAVLAYLIIRSENLLGPMITGRKRADGLRASEGIASHRTVLAIAVAAACALALYLIIALAPERSLILF